MLNDEQKALQFPALGLNCSRSARNTWYKLLRVASAQVKCNEGCGECDYIWKLGQDKMDSVSDAPVKKGSLELVAAAENASAGEAMSSDDPNAGQGAEDVEILSVGKNGEEVDKNNINF